MKVKSLFIIVLLIFISCNVFYNKDINYRQLESDKQISISSDFRGNYVDSVKLNIPLKFEISNLNDKSFLIINYNYNEKRLIEVSEYIIFENDYKKLFPLPLKPNKNNINEIKFYVNNTNIILSNQKAREITKKYNIEFDKWGERFRDTIQVATYQQFKKDFPEIFDELNAFGDSLIITTAEKGQKGFKQQKFPIKW
ncbi:hypothetical protein HXZ62_12715 [Empedobacter falsenii]|uniref:hypothetical protein n=1 Tax=Empedobacter falsenii TaxID=343874 RepID=UPI002578CFB9|nr:hypothetical protein [Empedobacter falsenii]MDM1063413.1 hypothetical protein [Empedobacter falsenii]